MSLTKLTENLNNISSLPDKPGISSGELKKIFDKAGLDIKEYLNEILTSEIDELISELKTKTNTNSSLIEGNQEKIDKLMENQKVLWKDVDGSFMGGTQTAQFSEKVSEQKNGIVLVFQQYQNDEVKHWGFYTYFFPKHLITLFGNGCGHCINIADNDEGIRATKYIYFHDSYLQGNDKNTSVVNIFGTPIDNRNAVLTAVIGV